MCHLLVPETVVEEALYYFDSNGKQIDINLRSQVNGGSISQIDPTLVDLFKFTQIESADCNQPGPILYLYQIFKEARLWLI